MVEIEPVTEEAYQHLIRLLALGGHRCAALEQYHVCRRVLSRELGVEPAQVTTHLYEAVREEKLETLSNFYLRA